MATMRADSTEYQTATITADHDITGATIEVALPTKGVAPSTWYPASLVGAVAANIGASRWTATYRLLIGPLGVVQLAAGDYDWTVRLTDTPERPVRKVGTLTITAT